MADRPTAESAQTARWTRREPLLLLLTRAARGRLLPAEGPLLRAAVDTELADAEQAHAELEQLRTRTRQLAAGRDTWRTRGEEIERDRDRLADERETYRAAWHSAKERAQRRTDERDRARGTAVALEQLLAAVAAECDAIDAEHYGQHDEDDDGARETVRRIRARLDSVQHSEVPPCCT